MRAILLQKDDYGLQKDRLHGRYGLTGKPTLTQTSIAGSLSSSFKAGQTVTLSNLRSLTAKLKEASLAISGSNANIQDIADNINKTNEASGEANKLLNDSLWKKFWDGTISPQAFYAAKYNEDESNERMLGEPGFPCTFSPFILPRTPFWDPWFEIRSHKTDPSQLSQDDLGFINNDGDLATKIALSESFTKIKQVMSVISASLSALAVLTSLIILSSATGDAVVSTAGTKTLLSIIISEAIFTTVDYLIDAMLKHELTELGGKKGRGSLFANGNGYGVPSTFSFQNWIEICMMDPNAKMILDAVQIELTSALAILTVGFSLLTIGLALSFYPLTRPIGKAIQTAAGFIIRSASDIISYQIVPEIIIAGCYVIGGICTRSPGENKNDAIFDSFFKADFAQYADKVDTPPYDKELFTSYGTAGQLPLEDSSNKISKIPGIKQLLAFVLNMQSKITSALGAAFSWILKERYFLGNSGFDRNSSEIRIYNYLPFKDVGETIKLQDFWGIDTPSFTWNYNLPNFDTIGAGSYVDGPLEMEQSKSGNKYISLKARVYNGNIYKIKAINKKSITHTVVIKGHMVADKKSNGHQWEYFSELALVCLDGDTNHLYLHHERNAIYNIGSVKAGSSTPTHAEQSFWNFDFKAGSSPELWSCRCGRMNYGYVDFADNVRLQYRPLTNFSNNYLAEELINTEYKYNNFFEKTTDMDAGMSGGLQSYANVDNE